MDGISAAASIIALVEMSVKVLSLTAEYSAQVKSAKKDIDRFHVELEAFIKVLRSLHELVQNTEATKLGTFRSLTQSIQQCGQDLEHLQMRLEPDKSQKAMSRYGVSLPLESDVKLGLAEQDRYLSKLSYASGANFDSNERQNEHYCLSDTRNGVRIHIKKGIFWLNGMAGTGKSTMARTTARTFTKQKRLAANCFFSRGWGDLSNTGKLLSTIAIQLAATSLMLKGYICEAIAEHENVNRQSLREQWTNLIYQPLSRVRSKSKSPLVLVFVFDALDECGRQEDIRTLLRLLAETEKLEAVKLRVLVTSRPELAIQLGFRAIWGDTHENFVLHNIASPVI
ncbi:hypothetical protein MMC29_001153 [Sticta canariensis]|nr:hypothetical protein [Sticta canariensis]